jgi:hypothetical protein
MCYDDILTQQPFGIYNPNITYSWTNQYHETFKTETPYEYNILYGNYKKYGAQVGRDYSETTTTLAQPYIVLPPNSTLKYIADNYLFNRFMNLININSARHYEKKVVDLEKVKMDLNYFHNKPYKYTLVYKLLSEEKWKSASIIIELDNVIIKETKLKD